MNNNIKTLEIKSINKNVYQDCNTQEVDITEILEYTIDKIDLFTQDSQKLEDLIYICNQKKINPKNIYNLKNGKFYVDPDVLYTIFENDKIVDLEDIYYDYLLLNKSIFANKDCYVKDNVVFEICKNINFNINNLMCFDFNNETFYSITGLLEVLKTLYKKEDDNEDFLIAIAKIYDLRKLSALNKLSCSSLIKTKNYSNLSIYEKNTVLSFIETDSLYHEYKKIVETSKKLVNESTYKKALAKRYKAKTEVKTFAGNIDVLSESFLIEIKKATDWKAAIGQLICYGQYYPAHKKVLAVYDLNSNIKLETILNTCQSLEISLWSLVFKGTKLKISRITN